MALGYRTIENATVMPTTDPVAGVMYGGVFDERMQLVPESLLLRKGRQAVAPIAPVEAKDFLPGEHIFAGYAFDHFGHFMLEGCSRLWTARERPDAALIWSFGSEIRRSRLEMVGLVGVSNEHVFLTQPMKVERLIVPQPAYEIQARCSPEMVSFMGVVEEPIVEGQKVWLSRSALPNFLAHVDGEIELESWLANNGWLIFHPQKHSLSEQLKMLASSEIISGFSGSAFHSLLMLKDYAGKILIFSREGRLKNKNYQIVADAKGLNQTIVPLDVEVDGPVKGHQTNYKLSDIRQIQDIVNAL